MNKSSNAKKITQGEKNPYYAIILLTGIAIGVILFALFSKIDGKNVFSALFDMANAIVENSMNIKKHPFYFICERYLFDARYFILIFIMGFSPFSRLFSSLILLFKGTLFGYIFSLFIRLIKETNEKRLIFFFAVLIIVFAFVFLLMISLCNISQGFAKNMRLAKTKKEEKSICLRYFYNFLSILGLLLVAVLFEALVLGLF